MHVDGDQRGDRALLAARCPARARGAAGLATVALALALSAQARAEPWRPGPGVTTVSARVLDSGLDISLDLDGYAKDDKPEVTRGQVILAGKLDTGKKSAASTSITLIAELNEPRVTSDELCRASGSEDKGNLQDSVEFFEVGDIACYEQLLSMTGAGISGSMVFFYAFPLVGDHSVEIRVSSTTFDKSKEEVWTHDRFVKLVRSIETGPSRPPDLAGDNGLPALSLPPELEDFRKQAAKQGKAAPAWIAEQCAARPDDWVVHFVRGEYGDRASLARAAELLGAKPEPTPKERQARFLAERVLGSRLAAETLLEDAIGHLEQADALAVLVKLPREARGALLYELACCHARSAEPDEALKLLKEAIKLDMSLREAARADKAFESLKEDKAFKSLVKS
jgi:hypothetical protein